MYKPSYRITPYLLNLIDQASSLRTWIELAPLQVAWLPLMQKDAQTKTAHFSTSIEGNSLTLTQVKAIARGEAVDTQENQEREVLNYLKAMHWTEQHSKHTIIEETIFELHQIITQGLLDEAKIGRYKIKQNYVVDEKHIKIYTPTPPKDTPAAIKDLVAWLNNPEALKLHCILTCAIFHHRFVSIHPFSDGNGRLARIMGTMLLYQREFDLHHIFSLDEFFAAGRKRYYEKIQQARELDNDLTLWIEYVAEGIVATLQKVRKRIEDLQVTSSHPVNLSRRQEETLRLLRDNHSLHVSDLIKELNVTRARINQILSPLVESGLVMKNGESRATRYRLNIH
ncbi:Fic family protein [Candidatus Saganbacteria bacterium]|nr:Fic family protein [Candidatus Saganbacteria bacterium]